MNSSLPSYIKCTMCSGLTVCCLRCCLIALLHGSVTWFSVWASLETAHGPASDSAPTYSVGRRLALKGVLGCNLPFLYCFCVGFTLRVNNTRVADRLYLYGQESCSLSSRPSATLYLRRLVRRTCCDDSGPGLQFYCDWLLFVQARYLVDPASSHMLVSKIKPCTSMFMPN